MADTLSWQYIMARKEAEILKKGGLPKGYSLKKSTGIKFTKQKGRVLKKMICDCKKGEHDNQYEKKLFGCECMVKTKVKGKWVRSKKSINDILTLDVAMLNKPDQYGDFTTNY